jgi:hypothetical protein
LQTAVVVVAPEVLLVVLVELEEPQAVEIYFHPAGQVVPVVLIQETARADWAGHQPLEVVPLVDKKILLAFLPLIHMVLAVVEQEQV